MDVRDTRYHGIQITTRHGKVTGFADGQVWVSRNGHHRLMPRYELRRKDEKTHVMQVFEAFASAYEKATNQKAK
jgi:hypothetical protein